MDVHDHISVDLLRKHASTAIDESAMCVIDADLPVESIHFVCNYCHERRIPVWFNPTDLKKCTRIVDANALEKVTYMSPNTKELFTIFVHTLLKDTNKNECFATLDAIRRKYESCDRETIEMSDLKEMLKYLLRYVPYIVLSRGSSDLIFACAHDLSLSDQLPLKTPSEAEAKDSKAWRPQIIMFPVLEAGKDDVVVNVTGAGDSASSVIT
jgi:hypothetical protein